MAGMFYSLQEAAEKLNKTEEELKKLIKAGKLKVFYDGPNPLLKIEEVEALASGNEIDISASGDEPAEAEGEQSTADQEFEKELGISEPDLSISDEQEEAGGLEELQMENELQQQEEPVELEISPTTEEEIKPEGGGAEEDLAELEIEASADEKGEDKKDKKPDDSIALAEETGQKGDIENEDTTLLGEGFDLDAGGTSAEKIDDLLAETKAGMETGEASGIDDTALGTSADDLSLDTFGSGGLLDVSLQADDTSLGGILEEIYTSEGGEEKGAPEAGMNMALEEEGLTEGAAPAAEPAMPVMAAYAEAAPDAMSNVFGIVLFIPLVAVVLTLIVAATGFNNVMPSFMGGLKSGISGIPVIWVLVAVFAIISVGVIGGASLLGSSSSKPKKEKKPKEKKAKAPKAKKEKKPKKVKEKKPKKKK